MKDSKKYVPISCDYYDELELWSIRQTDCEILYKENETITSTSGKIKDLYTQKGEEFLVLNTGQEIRLDQLLSINGKELSGYCQF